VGSRGESPRRVSFREALAERRVPAVLATQGPLATQASQGRPCGDSIVGSRRAVSLYYISTQDGHAKVFERKL
jgi:hypothetical protein